MCQVEVEFVQEVLENQILKFVNAFLLFCDYLPFEKGLDLHTIKLNPMLCAKFGWKCPNGSGEEDFKTFSIMYFYYFAITSTLRRAWPFILFEKNWIIFTQDALCQFWLKMAQCFWRRTFLKVLNVFLLFPNYILFEKGVALHLNKHESPSPKDAMCQVWLKLAHWFWRRRFFFKLVNLFLLYPNYLPFGNDVPLLLNKLESLSLRDNFCHVWLKLA